MTTDDLRARLAALPLAEREQIELAVVAGLREAMREAAAEIRAEHDARNRGSEEAAGVAA